MSRPRPAPRVADLELMPVMNLVSILIPMLLLSAEFVNLAVIDSAIPAITDEAPAPEHILSLAITGEALAVVGAEGVLPDTALRLPCPQGGCRRADDYDYAGLTRVLEQVKDAWPAHDSVVLVPGSRVSYEVLVRVMDAARGRADGRELFPNVVMAGGV